MIEAFVAFAINITSSIFLSATSLALKKSPWQIRQKELEETFKQALVTTLHEHASQHSEADAFKAREALEIFSKIPEVHDLILDIALKNQFRLPENEVRDFCTLHSLDYDL